MATEEPVGQVAVITGGASGFGLALAARCAERGMSVALLDRDGERAETEAAALGAAHGIAGLGPGRRRRERSGDVDAAARLCRRPLFNVSTSSCRTSASSFSGPPNG